jgi:hypothetical protein
LARNGALLFQSEGNGLPWGGWTENLGDVVIFNNPEGTGHALFAAWQTSNSSIVSLYLPLKALPPLAAVQMALAPLLICRVLACLLLSTLQSCK